METEATLRFARMSPQKCRLVADQIRGMPVERALQTLSFGRTEGARVIRKVLESAIANAEHNDGADIDELRVSRIFINEGPTLKRIRPRARGQANRIDKRTSHITVAVADS